ncbi:MAG: hypothetical protein H0V56_02170 [Chthoniobacterales bacterium]|nr:hypothetical protein [Chthoniobacterales bacterium]
MLQLHPIWDPLCGEPRFEKLLASLAPRDSGTKNVLAILFSYQNRREEAVAMRREAVALDPLNVILQGNLASDLRVLDLTPPAAAK